MNDLAVSGAKPKWLTLSMILEEGLPIEVLARLLDSVASAARDCGVLVVAGDTKVVPRGAADGVFLTTTGIGELVDPVPTGPQTMQPGDVIVVSGSIGRHGIAVLCAREELGFDPPPKSDSGSLTGVVDCLRRVAGPHIRTIRDATRGGVSAVLHEWAHASGLSFTLHESAIPVAADVRGVCELLGLDPRRRHPTPRSTPLTRLTRRWQHFANCPSRPTQPRLVTFEQAGLNESRFNAPAGKRRSMNRPARCFPGSADTGNSKVARTSSCRVSTGDVPRNRRRSQDNAASSCPCLETLQG